MKHFLAYGNSDQASFREEAVLRSFDILTVPGTIAAYYADATAGFVLTAEKPYIIDPRTPLLQGDISRPKASHLSLATWLGRSVEEAVGTADGDPVLLTPSFFTDEVVREMSAELVSRQARYGERGGAIQKKIDRYRRLRAEAQGLPAPSGSLSMEAPPPQFILAPYFASDSNDDEWWHVTQSIWSACRELTPDVSAVVAVTTPNFLGDALAQVPEWLARTAFFWLTGFDERRASIPVLTTVAEAVATNRNRDWVNLYGGFFSICLAFVGLWGFSNGLGYSESRQWPELATTGAAPSRYYVPKLHSFLSPAAAQLVTDADSYFACDCEICTRHDGRIIHFAYRDFREHFAFARSWELQLVTEWSPTDVATMLSEARERFRSNVAQRIPVALIPDLRHLENWAAVLPNLPALGRGSNGES